MTRLGYQIPNFTYPGIAAPTSSRTSLPRPGGRGRRVRPRLRDGPLLPAARDRRARRADVRVLHDAVRTGAAHGDGPALGAGHRQHLPSPDAARQGDHGPRPRLGWPSHARHRRGWFELEHDSLGFEFGTFTDRFEKLEEALQIIGPMLRGEKVEPRRQALPGERCDQLAGPAVEDPDHDRGLGREEDAPHGRPVRGRVEPGRYGSSRHPAQARRPRRALRTTRPRSLGDRRHLLQMVVVAPTMEEAEADMAAIAAVKGWNDEIDRDGQVDPRLRRRRHGRRASAGRDGRRASTG